MRELRELLLANLDAAYARRGWHGVTLRAALRGLSAEDVAWRPAPGRHNIWELTAHAAYWKFVARRRLGGAKLGAFPYEGRDWVAAPASIDDRAWQRVVRALDEEHRLLCEVVASLPDDVLRNKKKLRLLYGVAAHDVYHTGQIQLVKRLRRP